MMFLLGFIVGTIVGTVVVCGLILVIVGLLSEALGKWWRKVP